MPGSFSPSNVNNAHNALGPAPDYGEGMRLWSQGARDCHRTSRNCSIRISQNPLKFGLQKSPGRDTPGWNWRRRKAPVIYRFEGDTALFPSWARLKNVIPFLVDWAESAGDGGEDSDPFSLSAAQFDRSHFSQSLDSLCGKKRCFEGQRTVLVQRRG
jgi:hypothetical protein